jgi:hypothetical protein
MFDNEIIEEIDVGQLIVEGIDVRQLIEDVDVGQLIDEGIDVRQ